MFALRQVLNSTVEGCPMRMKSLILIFIALGCGLVASIGISQVMER